MRDLKKMKKTTITVLVGLIVLALTIKIGLWVASMLGFLIIVLALVILIPIGIKMLKKYKSSLAE